MTGEGIHVFKEKTMNPQEMRFRKAALHRLLQQDKLLDERARFNTVNDAIKRIAALKSDKS